LGEVHTVQSDIFFAEKPAFSRNYFGEIKWHFIHAKKGGRGLQCRKAISIYLALTVIAGGDTLL
jgi:hypothetical protein